MVKSVKSCRPGQTKFNKPSSRHYAPLVIRQTAVSFVSPDGASSRCWRAIRSTEQTQIPTTYTRTVYIIHVYERDNGGRVYAFTKLQSSRAKVCPRAFLEARRGEPRRGRTHKLRGLVGDDTPRRSLLPNFGECSASRGCINGRVALGFFTEYYSWDALSFWTVLY